MRRAFASLLAVAAVSAAAATVPPARFTDADRAAKMARAFPDIEKAFTAYVAERHMPGASMAIIIDGNIAWQKSTGFRDTGSHSPVTADTVFRIASMTKSFTAMSILKLRDDGKLSLDDPVAKYIPELATLTPATADSPAITIRHLLTHSEGFPEDNPWGDRQLARTDATLSAWMRAGIPFSRSPGIAYEYSNYGFAILGQIVQRVSGRPYAEYVRENILVPLGMNDTRFDVREISAERIAYGYRWEDGVWKLEPALPHGAFGAMGGLWTTPADLAKYVAFQLSAWPPRDDPERGPVRRSSAREMQQAWRFATASATRSSVDAPLVLTSAAYGYGLRISSDCHFRHIVGHGGGLPGYGSYELWLPEYGVGMIAFGNLTYAPFVPLFNDALNLLRATGGLERRQPQPSEALVKAKEDVSKLINRWDDKLADDIFAMNVFLDRAADRRAKDMAAIEARNGKCTARPFEEVENALRGTWRMDCERGWVDVAITMAPTMPPKVQAFYTNSILPPGAEMAKAIALVNQWNEAAAKELTTDAAKLQRLAAITRAQYGTCSQEKIVGDDAAQLACANGKVVLRLTVDPTTKKVTDVGIAPSRDEGCVP